MDNKLRIYTLNGLPPEVIAVAFAKCSRSADTFDKIAQELNEDKSRKFHEKWVVGYGHSSVAEHAVLNIAIENVSILATKAIEDNRLASYTEKSSRYQQFTKERYYLPEFSKDMEEVYRNAVELLLDKYTEMIPIVEKYFREKEPSLGEIEYKNKVFDNLRNILPVCCLTNLGMTINARNLERAISKLFTSKLKELQEIAQKLKDASLVLTPTLVKYTAKNEYLSSTEEKLNGLIGKIGVCLENGNDAVRLAEYDKDAIDKIVASIIYHLKGISFEAALYAAKDMDEKEKEKIISVSMDNIGKFDSPIREFESTYYTFDILIDYGAFRDIQRHRMVTQINPEFEPHYGFDVPVAVKEAGLGRTYLECMNAAKIAYEVINNKYPGEASYVLPMAFKKRVLMKMNFREAYHFIKLRSTKHGHESYRKISQEMWREVRRVQPFLANFIPVDFS